MSNLYHTVTLSRDNVIVRTSGGKGLFFLGGIRDLAVEKTPPYVFGSLVNVGGGI